MQKYSFKLILLLGTFLVVSCSQPEDTSTKDTGSVADASSEVKGDVRVDGASAEVEKTVTPGEAYLHINARKPGVQVLESGLQFEILSNGEGQSPGPTSSVITHYHGTFIDGRVFDSSVERGSPAEFPVNRVISGWTQALQMMKEGDKWRLVLPPHLAYGERGTRGIPPNSVLVFEVELLEVK